MLTDTKLRTLKPRESAYRIADTNGLCIEVRPSGAKVWRYRYRHASKPSIITMAEYPAMGLAEARAERDRLRALVRGRGSPANAARIERAAKIEQAATTFGAIAAELLAKRAKEGLSPGSVKRERRIGEDAGGPGGDAHWGREPRGVGAVMRIGMRRAVMPRHRRTHCGSGNGHRQRTWRHRCIRSLHRCSRARRVSAGFRFAN